MPPLKVLATGALYALLLWPPLASGANSARSFAVAQLLVLLAALLWLASMVAEHRLRWRRSALDLPLGVLIVFVGVQLALGHRSLLAWALALEPPEAPHPAALPAPFLALGTVSPWQTIQTLLVLLTYAAVYVLVVHLVSERRQLDRLIRTLLVLGGILGFLGLLDFLGGGPWLLVWREDPYVGRLAGTFANPDHFATWLGMLVCLGLGYLFARRGHGEERFSLADLVGSRQGLERLMRRYLPFAACGAMTVALIFTLSRGGLLAFLLGLGVLLVFQGVLGRARWSVVLAGVLLAVALGYGAWIGLEPLVRRVSHGMVVDRWHQYVSTLPMLADFPLLGVGLGAYREIYFRYVPGALEPARFYYPYAHSDLLQLLVELGLVGAGLGVWLLVRTARDLVGAHLLGRSRCPVAGGGGEGTRRSDPFSVGIAGGALAAVSVLGFHSAVDFAARIPAVGMLGAACLGLATVALHTRFGHDGAERITRARVVPLGRRARGAVLAGGTLATLALAVLVVRTPMALALVEGAAGATSDRLDLARTIDPGNRRVLVAGAQRRLEAGRSIWTTGALREGTVLSSWDERRRQALPLVLGAVEEFRAAVAAAPSHPVLHERLAYASWTAAAVDLPAARAGHLAAALTHFRRATVLAPEDPTVYRELAMFGASEGGPALQVGLRASRDAVARDPALLPEMMRKYLEAGLSVDQWVAVVPASAVDRLELGVLLERGRLFREALRVYQGAVEVAAPGEDSLARWRRARLLLRLQEVAGAAAELEAALARDPDNPELRLMRAHALAAAGAPGALEAYRATLATAEARLARAPEAFFPFTVAAPRARRLAAQAVEGERSFGLMRYRAALAQHLTDRGRWAEALAEWDAVLAASPEDSLAHFGRGMVLDGLGARERALEAYRRAVALDGRSTRFRLRLAQSLWHAEQYSQALQEWRTVIGQEPANVEARLALARVHLKLGEHVEAVRQYERVLQIVPDHAEARQAYVRLGGVLPR